MKALIINGSPHKNGPTSKATRLLADVLLRDVEHKTYRAYDMTIKPCIGCLKCRPDKTCILPEDDGHRIGKEMQEADLLIVSSPSYWSNMPAPMKMIFDRNVSVLEYCLDKPPVPNMTGKKAVLLLTAASDENNSRNELQFPLFIKNMRYILENSGYEILDVVTMHSSWNFENQKDDLMKRFENIKIS